MKGIEEIEEAEIAKFTPVELKEYEDSLKRIIGTGTNDSL